MVTIIIIHFEHLAPESIYTIPGLFSIFALVDDKTKGPFCMLCCPISIENVCSENSLPFFGSPIDMPLSLAFGQGQRNRLTLSTPHVITKVWICLNKAVISYFLSSDFCFPFFGLPYCHSTWKNY